MNNLTALLEEFIMKAIVRTEKILAADLKNENLAEFTEVREKLFTIMDQISQKIDWETVLPEKKAEFNRQFEFIKKLDDELLVKLHHYQDEVKKDIEKTFRQKESIKGYNLNDVK